MGGQVQCAVQTPRRSPTHQPTTPPPLLYRQFADIPVGSVGKEKLRVLRTIFSDSWKMEALDAITERNMNRRVAIR